MPETIFIIMTSTNPNIEFSYLYRDAGNYKKHNSIVLTNPTNITDLAILEKQIRGFLFDTEFFYPYLVDVPLIHFDDWDPELDHHWYEFKSLNFTHNPPDHKKFRTIEQFVQDLRKYAQAYDVKRTFF